MASSQANGRRGGQVNFSNFIQDLNVEVPSQNTSPVSEDWEKDLAMFTNTNFFEWEKASAGASADFALPEPETKPAVAAAVAPVAPPAPATTTTPREPASATSAVGDFDFSLPASGLQTTKPLRNSTYGAISRDLGKSGGAAPFIAAP
ncbi:hypothetical protein G7054_g1924 [Neopestalotiopsis clavispora]|nr:hypothetical protein G7054_g1924 [Neopestalotiopsis clavispora]